MKKKQRKQQREFREIMRLLMAETKPQERKKLKLLVMSIRAGQRDLRVS